MTRRVRLSLCVMLLLAGCASAPPIERNAQRPASGPALRFGACAFAFRNATRWKNPGKTDLYANYCFVMARGITQFQRFARFAPELPRVEPDVYTGLVRRVVARAPW